MEDSLAMLVRSEAREPMDAGMGVLGGREWTANKRLDPEMSLLER
jgi:hypothetical protein